MSTRAWGVILLCTGLFGCGAKAATSPAASLDASADGATCVCDPCESSKNACAECSYADATSCPDVHDTVDAGQDATPSVDTGPDVPDAGKDAGPGFASSKGGCAPWFGQGCGGCACEQAVCADTPECCSTLWGQACALECADKGGKCTAPDAGPSDGGDKDAGDSGPFACEVQYSGGIPGAKLDLSKTPCVFSIAKAGGKFPLPYSIVVKDATPLWNTDPNAGQCPPQNVFGGVATFVTVDGIGDGTPQEWCLCDVGKCAPPKDITYSDTTPGTYSHDFLWDGKNFGGPSDTGQQPGPAFPPGVYTFKVKSQGLFKHGDGTEDAYTATATLQIQLNP
jgi:hypothetical protein